MPLYLFALVVCSLGCGSLPSLDGSIVRPLTATLGMVVGWAILCHIAAQGLARQVLSGGLEPIVAARWLERQMELFRWLGLGIAVLCLGGFGLARTLDSTPLLRASMFLKAAVLLAPGLILCAASWSAENSYGMRLGYTAMSFRGHLRSVWLAFRGAAAWLIVPVLFLLGASDLIRLLPVPSSVTSVLTGGLLLIGIPVGIPVLVRYLFRTEPLDADSEKWVQQLLGAAGVKGIWAFRWDTGGRAFNALVAGVATPYRTLLISDRILDELPRPQLAMVLLHEAAHIRRRHVPLRMLLLLPAWGGAMLIMRVAGESEWATAGGTLVGLLLTMLVLRVVAHRTELDADAHACRLAVRAAESVSGVPESHEAAIACMAAALTRVTRDNPSARDASWLHPGLETRLQSLRSHSLGMDGETSSYRPTFVRTESMT